MVCLWESSGFGLTNSVLLCRPRHPFFELVLRMLPEPSFRIQKDTVMRTNPRFLTAVLQRYCELNLSRTQLCKRDPTASPDCVYIAPSHLFETIDVVVLKRCYLQCENNWLKKNTTSSLVRNECSALIRQTKALGSLSGEINSEDRLARHLYLHLGYNPEATSKDRCAKGTLLNTFLKRYWTYVHGFRPTYLNPCHAA